MSDPHSVIFAFVAGLVAVGMLRRAHRFCSQVAGLAEDRFDQDADWLSGAGGSDAVLHDGKGQ